MATIYKDYAIYYNGNLISNNTKTGLTSVDIYYNGTHLGEGAHTLNCSGKYMAGNVVIGSRTLKCSGKVMNGNVEVQTTNRYKWNKYNAVDHYSTTSETISAGSPVYSESGIYVYCDATGYALDSETGKFTLTGGIWKMIVGAITYSSNGYFSKPYPNTDTTLFDSIGYGHVDVRSSTGTITVRAINNCTKYSSVYDGKAKGGTLIGQVDSTNANAYPANGYQNGYWYKAV